VLDAAGLLVLASTAAGRGLSGLPRVEGWGKTCPLGEGEVPQAAAVRSPVEGLSMSAPNGDSWSGPQRASQLDRGPVTASESAVMCESRLRCTTDRACGFLRLKSGLAQADGWCMGSDRDAASFPSSRPAMPSSNFGDMDVFLTWMSSLLGQGR
jgi:hypothetical protein